MPQVTDTSSNMLSSFSLAFNNFIAFLPTLLGALVVLVVGWIIAGFVARLIEKGLEKVGFERVVARSGVNDVIVKSGASITMSHLVAELVKWMIRLVFIQAAANILGMPQITAIMNSIILFIPRIAVALAIIVLGAYAAGFLARIVQGSLTERKAGNPALFANLTRYAVIGFSVTAALSQLEVAPVVINSVFIALISSIALAVGLSFGLGGQAVAGELTRKWFERGKTVSSQGAPKILRGTGTDG